MSISLIIFIGAKDPDIGYYLNQCQTNCCLIDPDDVDDFLGGLPAFTIVQEEKILAYLLNVLRQYPFPLVHYHMENGISEDRQKVLENCFKQVEFLVDKQLSFLSNIREYQELFLHNSLINFIPAMKAANLSELQITTTAPLVFVVDDSQEILNFIKKLSGVLVVAPLFLYEKLKKEGIHCHIVVTNNAGIFEINCKADLLVMDLLANPKLNLSETKLLYTATNSELGLADYIDQSLAKNISPYIDEIEFSLRVVCTIAKREIYLAGEVEYNLMDEILEEYKQLKLLNYKKISNKMQPIKNEWYKIKKTQREQSTKKIFNHIIANIAKEKKSDPLYTLLLWSAEFQGAIKLSNGWVDFQWLNQVQTNLANKKHQYLDLLHELKDVLISNVNYQEEKFKNFLTKLPRAGLKSDFDFELKVLMQTNYLLAKKLSLLGAEEMPRDLKVEILTFSHWRLIVQKSSGIYEYYGHDDEYILNTHQELERNSTVHELGVNIIVIPGIMNGEMQLSCLKLFPEIPVLTLEPRVDHFAQLMHCLPFVSLMGKSGMWLQGSIEELTQVFNSLLENSDLKPMILDVDPQNLRDDLTQLKRAMNLQYKF